MSLVAAYVEGLLRTEATWTDKEGKTNTLGLQDILILAPYNAQVSEDRGDRLDIQFINSGARTILKTTDLKSAAPSFGFRILLQKRQMENHA